MGGIFRKRTKISHASFTLEENVDVSNLSEWTGTGITLTLPSSGTYSVFFNLTTGYSHSGAFDNHYIEGRIVNTNNEEEEQVITGTRTFLMAAENLAENADLFYRTVNIDFVITVTEETELELQAICHSVSSGANILSDYSSYGYLMLNG